MTGLEQHEERILVDLTMYATTLIRHSDDTSVMETVETASRTADLLAKRLGWTSFNVDIDSDGEYGLSDVNEWVADHTDIGYEAVLTYKIINGIIQYITYHFKDTKKAVMFKTKFSDVFVYTVDDRYA